MLYTLSLKLSRQALAFLRYLHDEKATYDNESPGSYRKIRGFLLAESDEHFAPGIRVGKVIKMGSRYNSVHRTVLKLHRNNYVMRTAQRRDHSFEYKVSEKGLDVLRERGFVE